MLLGFLALALPVLPQQGPAEAKEITRSLDLISWSAPGASASEANHTARAFEVRVQFDGELDQTSANAVSLLCMPQRTRVPGITSVEDDSLIFIPSTQIDASGRIRLGLEANKRYRLRVAAGVRSDDGRVTSRPIVRDFYVSESALDRNPEETQVRGLLHESGRAPRPLRESARVPLKTSVELIFNEWLDASQLAHPFTRTSTSLELSLDRDGNVLTDDDRVSVPFHAHAWLNIAEERTHVRIDPDVAAMSREASTAKNAKMLVSIHGAITQLGGGVYQLPAPLLYSVTGGDSSGRREIVENFDTNQFEDPDRTAAHWGRQNVLFEGPGGGSGLHGDLIVTTDTVFDTDSAGFASRSTFTGRGERVTNGVFQFGRIEIPAGVEVRFKGSQNAQIYATSGSIQGRLSFAGEDAPRHEGVNNPCPNIMGIPWTPNGTGLGGLGGLPGPAGGEGGSGGDDPRPIGLPPNGMPGMARQTPLHVHGRDGEGIGGLGTVMSGGGAGSMSYPATQITTDFRARMRNVGINAFLRYSLDRSGGGGGGSNATLGTGGQQGEPTNIGGPPGRRGRLQNPDPNVPRTSVGGSGGGGAGVHPFFLNKIQARLNQCPHTYNPKPREPSTNDQVVEIWNTGSGGGGGGGCGIVQFGRDLNLNGEIDASGGDGGHCFDYMSSQIGESAAGGGGAGGNVRVEVGGNVAMNTDSVSVDGGQGGVSALQSDGGTGGFGYVHYKSNPPLNAPQVQDYTFPSSQGSASAYDVADYSNFSRATSLFYDVRDGNPFDYLDFEVTYAFGPPGADPNDPSQVQWITIDQSSAWPAFPNGPFHIRFQGAPADSQGNPDLSRLTNWVFSPEDLDERNVFVRFGIAFNRAVARTQSVLAVLEVKIILGT